MQKGNERRWHARETLTIRMGPESKGPIPPQEEVLGRNLAAAFIATQYGMGMDYARKEHADEPVGEFWLSLARMVMEHFTQNPALPPRTAPAIQ
jgi:hypothetical protein